MPRFETQRRVAHRAREMFDLVADVESYPQFLPMCQALTVRSRQPEHDGKTVLIADMVVGYKAIREIFTSRICMDRPALKIDVDYIEGPFKQGHNRWNFIDLSPPPQPSCRVEFQLVYEFRNLLLSKVMGGVFDSAFRKFAEAFELRANSVYAANS